MAQGVSTMQLITCIKSAYRSVWHKSTNANQNTIISFEFRSILFTSSKFFLHLEIQTLQLRVCSSKIFHPDANFTYIYIKWALVGLSCIYFAPVFANYKFSNQYRMIIYHILCKLFQYLFVVAVAVLCLFRLNLHDAVVFCVWCYNRCAVVDVTIAIQSQQIHRIYSNKNIHK